MSKLVDMLMRPDTPNVQKDLPRADYELVRLSELYGEPFVLQLKAVPYAKALELQQMEEYEVQTVLVGDDSGIWKDAELQADKGAATPAELVKLLLLPGEIRSISVAVEQLSGYRKPVLRQWDPKAKAPADPKRAVAEEIEKN